MDTVYHDEIIRLALGRLLPEADLQAIYQANIGQDGLAGLLFHPEYHFDGNDFATPQRYIEAQRQEAVEALLRGDRAASLAALGRLLHARQDFYAHSNWIPLWAAARGGVAHCTLEALPLCLDPESVAGLQAGSATWWDNLFYVLYRIPLIGPWIRRLYLPPGSHEAMNIDNPGRGPLFPFVMEAAIRHTRLEFDQLCEAVERRGGPAALARLLPQGSDVASSIQ